MSNAKSVVNIEKLTVWSRTENDEATTYGTPVSLAKTLMTINDTPTVVSDDLHGDGEVSDTYYAVVGGTLECGLTGLTQTDRALFYGETAKDGSNVIAKGQIGSYVVVAHQSVHRDGTLKLTKYVRVLFSPSQEQEQQVTKSGVTWSTKTLSGKYSADKGTGVYKYIRDNVDPVEDAEIISKWFTQADYYGQTTGN